MARVLHQQLPVNHVVPRDRLHVREARVLHHARVELLQQHRGILHDILQLRLIRFVRVNAQKHVLSPHKAERWCVVVEPRHLEHVAPHGSGTIQKVESDDLNLRSPETVQVPDDFFFKKKNETGFREDDFTFNVVFSYDNLSPFHKKKKSNDPIL